MLGGTQDIRNYLGARAIFAFCFNIQIQIEGDKGHFEASWYGHTCTGFANPTASLVQAC